MPSQATRPPLVGMPAVWLRDNCPCPLCRDPVSGQRLLHITDIPAADLGGEPPRGSWPRYLAEAGYRRACQSAILREGLLLLSDVPTEPGAVLAVAASLGYVRETTYGRLFDVRVESSPSNLAFTSLPIPPHTDNPYRDPVPTVQLLHCLHNAADGGDSGFVDGFHAAAALRAQDRAAYAAFAELLSAAPSMLTVRLRPGDCAVFDNTRVLHARTGFARAGRRHLQGCYADLDGVESAVAVGERATTGVIRRKDRI
jgi:gamma-butyrobetaine dioxygenase